MIKIKIVIGKLSKKLKPSFQCYIKRVNTNIIQSEELSVKIKSFQKPSNTSLRKVQEKKVKYGKLDLQSLNFLKSEAKEEENRLRKRLAFLKIRIKNINSAIFKKKNSGKNQDDHEIEENEEEVDTSFGDISSPLYEKPPHIRPKTNSLKKPIDIECEKCKLRNFEQNFDKILKDIKIQSMKDKKENESSKTYNIMKDKSIQIDIKYKKEEKSPNFKKKNINNSKFIDFNFKRNLKNNYKNFSIFNSVDNRKSVSTRKKPINLRKHRKNYSTELDLSNVDDFVDYIDLKSKNNYKKNNFSLDFGKQGKKSNKKSLESSKPARRFLISKKNKIGGNKKKDNALIRPWKISSFKLGEYV